MTVDWEAEWAAMQADEAAALEGAACACAPVTEEEAIAGLAGSPDAVEPVDPGNVVVPDRPSALERMATARRLGITTLALTISYKGAAFCGFARQPGQLTVQGNLEEALQTLFAHPIQTVCAGRTDAGVHARGQVVSIDVTAADLENRTVSSIMRSLNALTHDDIVVLDVNEMPPGFSARFDARAREYRYFVVTGHAEPLFLRDFSWYVPGDLDVAAMEQASRCLIGEHDFKSFCKAVSAEGKPTCRNVSNVSFSHVDYLGEQALCITVTGNAFLHSMVRTIVGSLVMVGRGQRSVEWMSDVLSACDRRAAGECAPAAGLVFWRVIY